MAEIWSFSGSPKDFQHKLISAFLECHGNTVVVRYNVAAVVLNENSTFEKQ